MLWSFGNPQSRSRLFVSITAPGLQLSRSLLTITSAAQPYSSLTSRSVHWGDPRLISVEEARIAQGFPEQHVFIGYPRTQWKVVGSSGARGVAPGLGMSSREAWLANAPASDELFPPGLLLWPTKLLLLRPGNCTYKNHNVGFLQCL